MKLFPLSTVCVTKKLTLSYRQMRRRKNILSTQSCYLFCIHCVFSVSNLNTALNNLVNTARKYFSIIMNISDVRDEHCFQKMYTTWFKIWNQNAPCLKNTNSAAFWNTECILYYVFYLSALSIQSCLHSSNKNTCKKN